MPLQSEETPEYKAFVEKFRHKKTTGDCYTPDNVYQAVRDWAVKEYGLDGRPIIRPFWPGGDYESVEYPDGCVVIDNPPFSILSKICRYYADRGIDYFLFAPALTLFAVNSGDSNYILSGNNITYDNGATINTAFVSNLGRFKIKTSPELYAAIKSANDENKKPSASLPIYSYPPEVALAAAFQRLARYETLQILPDDCIFTRALDDQRQNKKSIFGGGFLLNSKSTAEKSAAEKAASEKAAAENSDVLVWRLSARERAMLEGL